MMPDCAECAFAAVARVAEAIQERRDHVDVGHPFEDWIRLDVIEAALHGTTPQADP
jgi:hypothetical protein